MLIYGALLVLDVIVIAYFVAIGASGAAYITISIVGLVGLLLAHHVWQHVRDLRAPLVETEGQILRKWKRADLVIAWDSHYINVERSVFKIATIDYHLVEEGMYATIVHFPRTLTVVSVHAVQKERIRTP